jgi:hypothetical protein
MTGKNMKRLLLCLAAFTSMCLADSSVSPDVYFKQCVIPNVTTEPSKILGSWEHRKSNTTISLESPDIALWSDSKNGMRGTWKIQKNGVIEIRVEGSAKKPFKLYCYVIDDVLIEDQICYKNTYTRK